MSAFAAMLKDSDAGAEVLPILRALLNDPAYKGFTVSIPDAGERRPDGWFHPSSHPSWTARQLYYYLVDPHKVQHEIFDPTSTMTVNNGHFWEAYLGTLLAGAQALVERNVAVKDLETGARGAMDGVLASGNGWECKTIRPPKLDRLKKGAPTDPEVLASFRDLVPHYYLQAQEYLRLSGRPLMVVLFVATSWPHVLREVHIPRDELTIYQIRAKYLAVREAVSKQQPPAEFCCSPRSTQARECPARACCPVGRA